MSLFDGIVKAIAGPIVGGLFGQQGQEDANAANAALSAENRAWQEHMSNTAHQREVKDLMDAGLNPMLSAKYGGASTPTGNVPVMQNTKAEMARGLSAVNAQQVENMEAQNKLLEAQTAKTEAEKAEIEARTPTHSQGIEESRARIEEITSRIPTYGASIEQTRAATKEITERINTYAPTIEEIRARTGLHSMNAAESQERINNLHATRMHIGAQIAETIAHTKESYVRQGLITLQSGLAALDQALKAGDVNIQRWETLIKQAEGIAALQSQGGANQNKFESDINWWGRNIRPYLRDFTGAASGAAAGATAGSIVRRGR